MKKKVLCFVLVFLLCACLFAACNPSDKDKDKGTDSGVYSIKEFLTKNINFANSSDIYYFTLVSIGVGTEEDYDDVFPERENAVFSGGIASESSDDYAMFRLYKDIPSAEKGYLAMLTTLDEDTEGFVKRRDKNVIYLVFEGGDAFLDKIIAGKKPAEPLYSDSAISFAIENASRIFETVLKDPSLYAAYGYPSCGEGSAKVSGRLSGKENIDYYEEYWSVFISRELNDPNFLGQNDINRIKKQMADDIASGRYTDKSYAKEENGEFYCFADYTEGVLYKLSEDGSSYTVTGANIRETTVSIPAEYNGKPVTAIGERAFEYDSHITSITIPNSVTSIGNGAFAYCTIYCKIAEASKPSGWANYWNGSCPVVWDCDNNEVASDGYIYAIINGIRYSLKTNEDNSKTAYVVRQSSAISGAKEIPASVTYNGVTYSVTSISSGAFYNCSSLTSITIGNGVTSIGERAFEDCDGLTSVTIPDSVTSIGERAFYWCSGLTSITIPDSVTSIGKYAFYDCSGLTSITIPDSVTSIGGYAFSGTAWYDNQPDGLIYAGKVAYKYKGTMPANTSITLKADTVSISPYAFDGCSGLTSITIGNSVTSIGNYAFRDCSGLTSVTIPSSVTSIGWGAFYDCRGLTSITIGNGVTSIGNSAFSGCSGLTSITVSADNANYASQDGILYNKAKTQIIQVPDAISGAIVLPNTLTTIRDSAFYNCRGLTSITIGNSVTSIGWGAFRYCSGLTSITIPNSVTTIGYEAFSGCTSLTTVNWNATNCTSGGFSGCTSITTVVIGNNVQTIPVYAFGDCSGLTSVTFANTTGWYVTQTQGAASGTAVDVTNAANNASRLKQTYSYYYWYRG